MADFEKDPNATLAYVFNWAAWLGTDTIASSAFQVSADLTKNSESNTTTTATVLLSGGTPGVIYRVRNRIVTTNGQTEDWTATIMVRDQ